MKSQHNIFFECYGCGHQNILITDLDDGEKVHCSNCERFLGFVGDLLEKHGDASSPSTPEA